RRCREADPKTGRRAPEREAGAEARTEPRAEPRMETGAETSARKPTAETTAVKASTMEASAAKARRGRGWCEREADDGRRHNRNQGSHRVTPPKGVAPSRSSLANNPEERASFSQFCKEKFRATWLACVSAHCHAGSVH